MQPFQITQTFPMRQFQPSKKKSNFLCILICIIFIVLVISAITAILFVSYLKNECNPADFKPKNQTMSKIINGNEAVPHSYPWIISLQRDGYGHICGGSIIDKRWILTAGHCINQFLSLKYYKVITGLHDRNIFNNSNVYEVIEAFSEFKQYDIHTKDFALLKLDRDIIFNKKVGIIKLSETPSKQLVDKCLITAGWGSISKTFQPVLPDKLQETLVKVIDDNSKCTIANKWDKNNVFCVKSSSKNPYSMTCSGDSGKKIKFYLCFFNNRRFKVDL